MWHRGEEGVVVCLGCHSAEKGSKSSTVSETSSQNGHSTNNHGSTLRRNTRLREKGGKAKQNKGGERQCAPTFKGGSSRSHQTKSRRTVLKQKPMRAAKSQPTIVTSDSMIHKGTTYDVGDIVSVLDGDGGVYYAIMRGFLQDQYAVKYATLTWLLPIRPNPLYFDPSLFVIGPEEDSPQPMEFLEFVCHSPRSLHFQASYLHDLEQAEQWKGSQRTH